MERGLERLLIGFELPLRHFPTRSLQATYRTRARQLLDDLVDRLEPMDFDNLFALKFR